MSQPTSSFSPHCEKCNAANFTIVEYKDEKTKKVLVDYLRCEVCGYIRYVPETISKRDMRKKLSES